MNNIMKSCIGCSKEFSFFEEIIQRKISRERITVSIVLREDEESSRLMVLVDTWTFSVLPTAQGHFDLPLIDLPLRWQNREVCGTAWRLCNEGFEEKRVPLHDNQGWIEVV
jgi:hypothetical protein